MRSTYGHTNWARGLPRARVAQPAGFVVSTRGAYALSHAYAQKRMRDRERHRRAPPARAGERAGVARGHDPRRWAKAVPTFAEALETVIAIDAEIESPAGCPRAVIGAVMKWAMPSMPDLGEGASLRAGP